MTHARIKIRSFQRVLFAQLLKHHVFPQQSTPKHEVLVERWDVAHQLLEQNGMGVLAHGGDGDSPQLSAMLTRACTDNIAFGSGRCIFSFPSVPAITGGFLNVSAPARRLDLDGLGVKNVTVPVLHFQDPSHLLLKMRWRITGRGGRGVRLSPQGNASIRLLAHLLENEESVHVELDHGLRKTDLNPKDKMNFPAAERLFSERIIAALDMIPDATAPPPPPPLPPTAPTTQPTAPVPPAAAALPVPPPTQAPLASQPKRKQRSKKKGSNGDTAPPPVESDGQQKHKKPRKKKKTAKEKDTTDKQASEKREPLPNVVPPRAQELAAFLRLGRAAVFAFLGRGLSARERLKQAWFARYFADGWRAWLVENGLPLTHEFLSTNQYSCIKLNAESLLLFYHWLCSEPELRKKVPASVFGFGSQQNENLFRDTRAQGNDPNFTVEEFQRRVTLAQELALIRRTHEGVFVFAKHHKHTASDHIRRPAEYLEEDFSEHMVRNCLMEALSEARALLDALGMKLKKLTSDPAADALVLDFILSLVDLDDNGKQMRISVDDEPSDGEQEAVHRTFFDDEEEEDLDLEDLAGDHEADSSDEENADKETKGDAVALPITDCTRFDHLGEYPPAVVVRSASTAHKFYLLDSDTGRELHLGAAAAVCSEHAKQSSDRCMRVRQAKTKKVKK